MAAACVGAACSERPAVEHARSATSTPRVALLAWARRIDTPPGEYTAVGRVVDVADSLVLLTDVGERQAWRLDPLRQLRARFGTRGDGPGEYQQAGLMLRVHADSVVLPQGASTRPFPVLAIATGRGRTHRLDVLASSGMASGGLPVVRPVFRGADCSGAMYGAPPTVQLARSRDGVPVARGGAVVPIVCVSSDGRTLDTLTRMPTGEVPREARRDAAGSMALWADPGPYAAPNGWTMLPDGHVVFVDAARYAFTLVDPRGRVVRRWSVPFSSVRMSVSGWQAHLARAVRRQQRVLERAARDPRCLSRSLRQPDRCWNRICPRRCRPSRWKETSPECCTPPIRCSSSPSTWWTHR